VPSGPKGTTSKEDRPGDDSDEDFIRRISRDLRRRSDAD
jgi:hypothetical protein